MGSRSAAAYARGTTYTPILMLTARAGKTRSSAGAGMGDDYVAKPSASVSLWRR
jgi:DNA-binding response OmpR family regulator